MKSAYQLRHPEVCKALYHALSNDPFYIEMERRVKSSSTSIKNNDNSNHQSAMLAYLDYSIHESKEYGECFIHKNKVGASIWSKPISKQISLQKSKKKQDFITEEMGEDCFELYQKACLFMDEKSSLCIPDNSWYLSIVGIHPDLQGQGEGKKLISPGLEKCDLEKAGCYLETFTPRNKAFYKRLGFDVKLELFEPNIRAYYSIMYRKMRI